MKLNKKYFSAVLDAFAIQIIFGINLVNAMQCEKEIEYQYYNQTPQTSGYNHPDDGEPDGIRRYFDTVIFSGSYATGRQSLEVTKGDFYDELVDITTKKDSANGRPIWWDHRTKSCEEYFQNRLVEVDGKYGGVESKRDGVKCVAEYMIRNNCNNIEVFKYKKGSSLQSSSNNSSSNQSSSSGASPNGSSSSAQSNSPESYNLQVSQTNKQNYQTIQRAYEQANAGRGKKHNKEANAIECMKNNPAQKSFKNNCNQPINFAYCFSGTVSGAKNESPQTLADLNCQGGQFGMLTIGAGENIPGSYQGLALEGLACKSPSQPVDMAFDRAANAATGRCSY